MVPIVKPQVDPELVGVIRRVVIPFGYHIPRGGCSVQLCVAPHIDQTNIVNKRHWRCLGVLDVDLGVDMRRIGVHQIEGICLGAPLRGIIVILVQCDLRHEFDRRIILGYEYSLDGLEDRGRHPGTLKSHGQRIGTRGQTLSGEGAFVDECSSRGCVRVERCRCGAGVLILRHIGDTGSHINHCKTVDAEDVR